MPNRPLDHVDYATLDRAKQAFINAGKRTLRFAEQYGFMPGEKFGASANVFSLNLKPYLTAGTEHLYITLLPEGLGTADDAKPEDLTETELKRFWYNIGIKTVAVTTNDVASAGMQPILLSLYLPSSNPELVFNPAFMEGFLDGFVDGCEKVGCVYFSGETPQLKGKIVPGKIDIAGAVFGVVPPGKSPVHSAAMQTGDFIVLIESSGPHENGFTSLRKLAESLPEGYRTKLPDGREYWEAINAPSHLYTPLIQDILREGITPSNIEPITGHGWQKLMRSETPFTYTIEQMMPVPPLFTFVQEQSKTPVAEMVRIFNYGTGLAIFVHEKKDAARIVELAARNSLAAVIAGSITENSVRSVDIKPLGVKLTGDSFTLAK